MTFTVEDGTGLAASNAYLSTADFVSHQADRGIENSFSTAEQEQAIVRATDYVEKRFSRNYRGFKSTTEQSLQWPRSDAYDDNGYQLLLVPNALGKAIAEYAMLILQIGSLTPTPSRVYSTVDEFGNVVENVGGQVRSTSVKVGPVEEKTVYQTTPSDKQDTSTDVKSGLVKDIHIPDHPIADLWMQELIASGSPRNLVRGD